MFNRRCTISATHESGAIIGIMCNVTFSFIREGIIALDIINLLTLYAFFAEFLIQKLQKKKLKIQFVIYFFKQLGRLRSENDKSKQQKEKNSNLESNLHHLSLR